MIARVEGVLERIDGDRALVSPPGGVSYEVMLPAYAAARLAASIGRTVTLHTLHFMEQQAQGGTIHPRLAGFLSREDRAFFELFVTCKGIGHRRALRAMTLDIGRIASAIADRDLATLQSLPEVGKRTAETIVVTLKEKMDRFLTAAAFTGTGDNGRGATLGEGATPTPSVARDALEALLKLGENRIQAIAWIDQVLARDDAPTHATGVITEVYRIKAGA